MNIENFLNELLSKGLKLWVKEDKLKYEGTKEVITNELLNTLKKYKLDIIKYFKERLEPKEAFPLSLGQQALWYQHQIAPESPAYNISCLFTLQPDLDIKRLKECFKILFKRHPILRTTYKAKEGICLQQIQQDTETNLNLYIIDTSEWTDEYLNDWIKQESHAPFDLEQSPVRIKLLTRYSAAKNSILSFVFHHIACDYWSLKIFIDELCSLYESNMTISLPYSSFQYKDYVEWHQKMLTGEEAKKSENYWLKQLSGELTALEGLTDHPRPRIRTYCGKIQTFDVDADLSNSLQTTPYVIFLTAYMILLHRYTGKNDIIVGSPFLGRTKSDFDKIFGYFINPVVLRADFSENPSVYEMINEINNTVLSAFKYQDYPFQLLIEKLNFIREPSISPVYQVSFGLEKIPEELKKTTLNKIEKGKLILNYLKSEQLGAAFELDLLIIQNDDNSFKAAWKYNNNLFEDETIRRMNGHFQTILKSIISYPKKKISEINILTQEEKQKIYEWNDTKADYPKDKTIVDLFEEQVQKTPDAIAVIFEESELTYKKLNEKSNQLAHYLINNGVCADVLVGICVERSLEMIISLLGILKAGGAYVPIDPTYPKERIDFMISDSNASIVLTKNKIKEILLNEYSLDNPKIKISPENLAYVIYTSGSTGTPKGVMISNKSLSNHMFWMQNKLPFTSEDIVFQKTLFSFDASIWEYWAALISGAKLLLASPESHKDIDHLVETINTKQITILQVVPSLFQLFLEHPKFKEAVSLKRIFCGGEHLPEEIKDKFYKIGIDAKLYNLYGPTEATIDAACYHCDKDKTVSIGKPISNTQIYILDKDLNYVPIGVPGEIYIGGDGLARGYLNRPDLTKERFIETSFGRLYKTGDLGRFLPDGNIEYIGRIDNQIKLRGFRIELGEIESVISKHAEVKESAVVFYDNRLIAYVTSNNKNIELKDYLKLYLPDYMLPASIVVIDKMPQTPNGKIDRKALLKTGYNFISSEYISPSTEIEQKLANIWKHVLKLERIGVHDNFFELGGDSILSIQIVSKAKAVSLSITPKDIFLHQTIYELARAAKSLSKKYEEEAVTGDVPLTPIQQWFFEQKLEEPWHYNQAVLLTIPQDIDTERLNSIFSNIINHHDAFRLRFIQNSGGVWKQTYLNQSYDIELNFEDLSNYSKDEQSIIIEEKATKYQISLNLSNGPLMRTAIFDLGDSKRLFWCIHHLVIDGVSWRILLEDFNLLYSNLSLPQKTNSFQAWSKKLMHYAPEKNELEYWRKLPHIEPLPIDNDAENLLSDIKDYNFYLDELKTSALLKEAQSAYHTRINDLLLCALLLGVRKWSGCEELLIDLEGHGRVDLFDDIDITRTVGWFTSVFPVCLKSNDTKNLGETIKSVKEQLRKIPNDGIGYGILKYLAKENLEHKALILFNYLGQFDQSDLFGFAEESSGESISKKGKRNHLLEINSLVQNNRLCITISYSDKIHNEKTIKRLSECYLEYLSEIIDHCTKPDVFGYTPSDFPDVSLSQNEIDIISNKYNFNISDIYPLTPMQEGMLFHTLYSPETGNYFEQMHFLIKGEIDLEILKKSWQYIIDRHPVLRTGFIWDIGEKPIQIVHKQARLTWNYVEIEENKLNEFLRKDMELGLNLAEAPLMRCSILPISKECHRFILSHHHMLLDGWCLPIIFNELTEIYDKLSKGQIPILNSPPPFKEYIVWQQKQDKEKALIYWKDKLKGFETQTPIPIAKQTKAAPVYESYYFDISKETTDKLKTFSREYRITLNTITQGAWGVLLSKYSGEKDIVFGVTVSGRNVPISGIEQMIGLFINTLPLRIDLESKKKLINLFLEIQNEMQESNQYAYCPLTEIQSQSDIPKQTALFDSILVFENYPIGDNISKNMFSVGDIHGIESTNYPITLAVMPSERLSFNISYDKTRFNEDSIIRLANHLKTILENIAKDIKAEISSISVLTDDEENQFNAWNDTKTDYPKDKTIVDLFEEQVEKTPDAIAVIFEESELTYKKLNEKSNQLAHFLINNGVCADVLVGICVERSLEMIIGLIGILKAGGAYVPIDPVYPKERINFMLKDSNASIVLTQDKIKEIFITEYSCANPKIKIYPENLAYVIYTSGTTGNPKGAMIEHKGLYNLAHAQIDIFNVAAESKIFQFASINFDASISEIAMSLCKGASLFICKKGKTLPDDNFVNLLIKQKITHITLPPSFLSALSSLPLKDIPELKCLIVAGESCPLELAKRWLLLNERNFFNAYGPTEYSVCATIYKCGSNINNLPIGKPISNTQIYILDNDLKHLPIGISGEICIGGDGLARGYLNRPDLTKERFIETSFGKLYKTGDLGRFLPDGNIEYIGRIDNQIKLRGFRIELGEIESVIAKHSEVKESAVVLYDDKLIAYVTSDNKNIELKEYLKLYLPDYMLPASIVVIDKMPMTPNGKIDRKSLPKPDIKLKGYIAPRNSIEIRLTNIWEQVIGVSPIGTNDNFFELGGHSLLAVRLMAYIHKEFEMHLPLSNLFQHPTIAELAELILKPENSKIWSPLVKMKQGDSKKPVFMIPGAGGNLIYFWDLIRNLNTDRSYFGLLPQGLDGKSKPAETIEEIASEYIKAIHMVDANGPYWILGHSFGGKAAFETSQQLQKQGKEVALLIILDAQAPEANTNSENAKNDDASWLIEIAGIIESLYKKELNISYEDLKGLSYEQQLNCLNNRLIEADIYPPYSNSIQLRGLLEVYKANVNAYYQKPQNIYSTNILLIKAKDEAHESDTLGWDKLTKGKVNVCVVPGDHLTMMIEPNVEVMAKCLMTYLE
ncbi:MAG: amino acid adenylation domain-containing protein [Desulfobacterales bacterium]|nr:amino acid adenylation domain-containing protein [Desulfobacterales bacterium]